MARRKPPTVHGVVLLDKPAGMTSHDAVNILRRHFGEKRIGHAGTLDPDATGLLVVGVGNATRLFRFMENMDKTYSCEIVFGSETNTLDDSGEVTATYDMTLPPLDEIRNVITQKFLGDIMQVPPMVSALKVDGKRLHELAREGIEIERAARPVRIDAFDVEATDNPLILRAFIRCGGGTYIRSLCADLGTALGGGAHIRTLRRHSSGPYSVDEATSIENPVLLSVNEAIRELPVYALDDEAIDDVLFGRVREAWEGDGPWAVTNQAGELVAVFELWKDRIAKPTVVFGGR